jgi:spermidine/putrescine transport system permease protein
MSKYLLGVISILVYVFIFLPIVILVMMSFSSGKLTSFPPEGFTLTWYQEFMHNRYAWSSLAMSVVVALFSALLTVIIGTMAAYGLVRFDFPGKKLLQAFVFMPIVIPIVVSGIAMLIFFRKIGLESGIITVTIAHISRSLPYAVMIISSSLIGFDTRLEEAAADLGAGEFNTFRKIVLPLIAPGLIGAALISFTVSFDEFVVTFFVAGGGIQTLPLYLYSQIRFAITPEINAISTFVLAVSMILGFTVQFMIGARSLARKSPR